MTKYTVWICEADGSGTTHVSSHDAKDPQDAAEQAIAETLTDWDWTDEQEEELHVLGIAKGDIELIEWNDISD